MSHFFKHLKGIAKTLGVSTMDEITGDYYKNLFEEEYSRHAETTRELADTKATLYNVNQSLEELNKEKKMAMQIPLNVLQPNRPNSIDVPVDLGSGFVVIIQGLPGRPTVASCERLCKVIMAYAVEAPATSVEKVPKMPLLAKKTEEVTLNESTKALVEEVENAATLEMDFTNTEQAVQANTKKGK